ncbi:MAG TPA: hypothetical protein VHM91_08650 [Verrucomicrobiales bacterium]|jgi:hypothetical protein|nr:hypothetical protein [Verrucomicrobiales bacterium]
MYPLQSSDSPTSQPLPAIALERNLVPQSPQRPRRGENLRLSLDEKGGETGGFAITIMLPASYLSKVSRIRLEAIPQ